jgi:hypothetical protein
VRVRGSFAPARGLTTGQAAPNGQKGGEYENTYLVEAEGGSFSRRRDQADDQPGQRTGGRRGVAPEEHGSLFGRRRLYSGVEDLSRCGSKLLSRKRRARAARVGAELMES